MVLLLVAGLEILLLLLFPVHSEDPYRSLAVVLDRMLASGITSRQLRGGRRGPRAYSDAQGPSKQQGARVLERSRAA